MSDVFISYSRTDKAFVETLHQALKESTYDAWVDWQDIPLTADWWQEIEAGIEAADTFIFVISPDSVESKVCGQEIDHAVANNKRLVPIVRREGFDMTQVRPALGKHNWLFFKEENDFDAAFAALVNALNTDLEHVKTHTQLLVRSHEWHHKDYNPDLLLRGTQLKSVLDWITKSADKDPRLTAGQREYVAASSQAESDRQEAEIQRQKKARKNITLALVGASIGFVIATALGVIAVQRQHIAQQREVDAWILAQSLKVESLFQSGAQVEALTEAIRGHQYLQTHSRLLNPDHEMRITTSLQQVLYGITEQNRLEGHDEWVRHLRFSPDGQTLVSGDADGNIKVWNSDGEELHTITKAHETRAFGISQISFNPNGQTFASGDADGTIKLWNLSGEELQTFEEHGSSINSIAFSPDGQTLASASSDNTVKLWSIEGQELRTFEGHSDAVNSVTFSSDGRTLTSASSDNTVKLWSIEGQELQTFEGHSDAVNSVTFSPDGQILVSGDSGGDIRVWNLDGQELTTFEGHSSQVQYVGFGADGQTVISVERDGVVKFWNLDGEELKTISSLGKQTFSVSFTPDGQTFASTKTLGRGINIWNLDGEEFSILNDAHQNHQFVSGSFSPTGKMFAAGDQEGNIKLWNLESEETQTISGHDGWVIDVQFSPDGKRLVSAGDDGTRIWNLVGEELAYIEGEVAADVSPDGHLLASATYSEEIGDYVVKLWNMEKRKELRTLEGHRGLIRSIQFSPDGHLLASAGDDGNIKLWNLDGQDVETLEGHTSWITSLSFSPDNQILASVSFDGSIKLWNLENGEVKTLANQGAWIESVRFNPDGHTLVSSDWSGVMKVWNLKGDEIKTLDGLNSAAYRLRFSPDGNILVSFTGDGQNTSVKFWNLGREDLIEKSCNWLNNYHITHPDILLDLTACHTPERLEAAAPNFVRQAIQSSSQGEMQQAEQQLAIALSWNPKVDLDPNTVEVDQNAAQTALKFTALHHRRIGMRLAEQLEIDEAIRAFEKAIDLNETLDLNPDTEDIEQDPEAIAHQLSVPGKIIEGRRQVRAGDVQQAVQTYQTAQDLDPNYEIKASDWNFLCREGVLRGGAQQVLDACENAVLSAPSNGNIVDSRGLARTFTGDVEGAIADFQYFIEWTTDEEARSQRQEWIEALEAGENPFTPEVLESLR